MSRQVASAERRAHILDAAWACFAEEGLPGIRVQAVSSRSGASVGSLYHHFGDLGGLVLALYRAALDDGFAALREALRGAEDAEAGMRGMVRAWLGWVAREPVKARLIYDASGASLLAPHADSIAAFKMQFYVEVAERMGPWIAAGQLRPLPLWALDPVVMGPAHEVARRWLLGAPLPMGEAADWIADAVWRSVRP